MNGRGGLLVAGFCPMGCGETLLLTVEGRVVCMDATCPTPDAAHRVLADPETEHVVRLGERDFTVRHPLRERIGSDLFDCDVHQRVAALTTGRAASLGDYRVRILEHGQGSSLTWERL